jgi:transcriptional regulator with XRE-family HTH domain
VPKRRATRSIADELGALMAAERERSSARPTTIRQLAARLDVNQGHLSRMLSGTRPLPAKTIAAIAKIYGVAPDFFAEYRRARVIELAATDLTLLDAVYDRITSRES